MYIEDCLSQSKIDTIESLLKVVFDRNPITINGVRSSEALSDYAFSYLENDTEADSFIEYLRSSNRIDPYSVIDFLLRLSK